MAIYLGSSEVSLYLGSQSVNAYLGGALVTNTANPFATLVSTKSTGNVSGDASSTTGYIKVEWWDSTTNVYGTGDAQSSMNWSKAAGGAGSKTIKIYPTDANGDLDGELTLLECSNNSLTSLNVSGLTALEILLCINNSLTSLNVSGLTLLTSLSCNDNSLTSLRAVDVPGATYYSSSASYPYPYYGGVMAANNNLDAAALDQLYTDLADNSGGDYALVFVGGNPGTTGHDPTIATAKNWVVLLGS
jgi:Leucine-rich repeat (LRR) protein